MKPILFIPMLILVIILAACAPVAPTEAIPPQASPTATTEISVLIWNRSGGFAGFCDEVTVSESGWAEVVNCKGETQTRIQLTETQRAQLDGWLETLDVIDYSHTDPATADAMTVTLFLAGRGSQQADEETIGLISQFASDLVSQAAFNLNRSPEVVEAESALQLYLTALAMGDYISGAKLYGGETDLLETWNPDIANDLPKLFERACAQNGLVCMAPRTLTYRGLDVDGNHLFDVEFTNLDGALFVQGPCCGDESGATFSSFTYRVKKIESGFVVLDLPPYVP